MSTHGILRKISRQVPPKMAAIGGRINHKMAAMGKHLFYNVGSCFQMGSPADPKVKLPGFFPNTSCSSEMKESQDLALLFGKRGFGKEASGHKETHSPGHHVVPGHHIGNHHIDTKYGVQSFKHLKQSTDALAPFPGIQSRTFVPQRKVLMQASQ